MNFDSHRIRQAGDDQNENKKSFVISEYDWEMAKEERNECNK